MHRFFLTAFFFATVVCAEHKSAPAGAPPAELQPSLAAVLQKEGVRLMDGDKPVCDIWLRSTMPAGPRSAEDNVTLATIPHGALLGIIRFPERGSDRRGQTIQPGLYTLRFSMFPQNGDHQGVAPQRDFLLLTPAAADKDPAATPKFEELVAMSGKASGTPHPAVLSFWKAEAGATPGVSQMGEHDVVLVAKIGDTPVSIILVGKAEG